MGSRRSFSCFLLLILTCHLVSAAKYSLPLLKDESKTQFYTTYLIGTPPVRVYVAVDLSNQYSWLACDIVGYTKSSTYSVIPCQTSELCPSYSQCNECDGPAKPSCNKNSCGAYTYTPWTDSLFTAGLIADTISTPSLPLPKFPFACTDKSPLKGLSSYTKGVVTLARVPSALHERVSSSLNVPRKFALCLPSSAANAGALYFGGGPYNQLKSLTTTTALVVNPHSTSPIYNEGDASVEYFVGARSIKIDGTPLKFNASLLTFDKQGNGGTKISTMQPYAVLHSQIYKPFSDLFVVKAIAMKVEAIPPVAPFGWCFRDSSIRYDPKTGKGLPAVDIVMNNNARWRIYGSNYMVRVGSTVSCLGFVDGGNDVVTPIVIGAKQLEDNLVEFDLEANKVGFTSSLLPLGTSCSKFKGLLSMYAGEQEMEEHQYSN